MEISPKLTFMVLQGFAVVFFEIVAIGIEEWQKEPDVPSLIRQLALPPFKSRALFMTAYLGTVAVFFSGA